MTPDPYLAVPKWLDAVPVPHRLKIILLRVDDHRNHITGQCNPRLQTLARETGLSIRSVTRALGELRRRGLVTSRRGQRGNHYVCAPRGQWRERLTSQGCPMANPVQLELAIFGQSEPPVSINEPHSSELLSFIDVPCVPSGVRAPDEPAAAARQEYKQPEDAEPQTDTTHPRCTPRSEVRQAPENFAPPEKTDAAAALATELAAQHPEPGLLGRVPEQIRGILRAVPNLEGTLARIRESHNRWRIFWLEHPGRFRPQLWRWFHDGDWEHPPVDAAFGGCPPQISRKSVSRETTCAKCSGFGFVMVTRGEYEFSAACECRKQGAA